MRNDYEDIFDDDLWKNRNIKLLDYTKEFKGLIFFGFLGARFFFYYVDG